MDFVKKIMMVDDDPDLLALLKLKLEKTEKFKVVHTTNGSEAVNLARDEAPDLIILDIEMPEMDGGDVARSLSGAEYVRDIPILFLSSMITKTDIAASGGFIGGRHMAAKSGTIKDLISKIDSMLE